MKNIIPIVLVSTLLFSACKSSKMSTGNTPVLFDKQGHRGARGLMPENTIPAMYKAIDLGVTTLEMDIVFTADNIAILSHEPFFNEVITTYPQTAFLNEKEPKLFNIYKMDFASTQNFDVGMKTHPDFPRQQKLKVTKPSLAALIDSVEAYTAVKGLPKVFYNIETKTNPETDKIFHPAPAAFTDMLMKVIKAKNIEDRVIIQSFDMRTLQYLHKKYPSVKTALLTEAENKSSFRKQLNDLGFNPTIYSPEHTLVTANLIAECHEKNIRIIPWTVNDKKRIASLKKMGVDGIITDYPNLF
ncbi:MAG: glycerophosphodiester phosphodiesterase family protein [Ferruginibacter sp.]